jgi:hypothetical protein
MRRQPNSWTNLFAKLGLYSKKRRPANKTGSNRRLRFEQCEDRHMLTPLTVNVDYDVVSWVDTDSEVSLREAVERANIDGNADVINFAPGLNGRIIKLGKDANDNTISTGALNITESVTIDGRDSSGNSLGITIDASGNDPTSSQNNFDGSRAFNISTSYYSSGAFDVTLQNLTITGSSHVPAEEFMSAFALAA